MTEITNKIVEYNNLKIAVDCTDEEERQIRKQKEQIYKELKCNISSDEYECLECCKEITDLNTFIEHEIKCYHLKLTVEEIIDMLDKTDLARFIPINKCDYCSKTFSNQNLLNQHLHRGKKFKCVEKTTINKFTGLSINDKIKVLNFINTL